LIVVDGGSSDGTLDKLNYYRNKIDVLITEPDRGIYDALNKGLKSVTGDIIGFLHANDLYFDKGVLTKIVNAFSDTCVDVVYGDLLYVENESTADVVRYWRSGTFRNGQLKYGWMPPHPTLYLRSSVYEKFGSFNIKYSISADYDFMLRILLNNSLGFFYISDVLVRMRIGGISNRSLATIVRKSLEDLKILRHHKVGGVFTLLCKNFRKLNQFISR
jgi:glycosyltransferase